MAIACHTPNLRVGIRSCQKMVFPHLKQVSLQSGQGRSLFFTKEMLEDDQKVNTLNLRMFNILTGGKVDTCQLLELLEPVNAERDAMALPAQDDAGNFWGENQSSC